MSMTTGCSSKATVGPPAWLRPAVTLTRALMPEWLYARLQAADHYLTGEPEIRLLRHLCQRDRVSIDVGANIGTYTYFMRRHSKGIVAFEPNPDLAARLGRLFPRVDVRAQAVSDRGGTVRLAMPMRNGRPVHELASVAQNFAGDVVRFQVPCVRLDDAELPPVGFIKIDVEQHEMAVLAGAEKTIEKYRPLVMTEVSALLYPRPLPEMFPHLTGLGYRGWFRFAGSYHPFSDFRPITHANPKLFPSPFMGNNVIFLPPGSNDDFLRVTRRDVSA